ncbi:hypothetical protein [Streptomyces sp. NBC_01361]|uniref:hypothetical protein n=1 Tax=Streptomyces sp. NBC_01361 TaxID=2903838 RepID=UPI002E2F4F29|nr:hypothetical protein [Streptomyces sp. NBC_01361]
MTFVEQVCGLTERYRRSSVGLGWLRTIDVELGGRAAARLCHCRRLTAARTRLLRVKTLKRAMYGRLSFDLLRTSTLIRP